MPILPSLCPPAGLLPGQTARVYSCRCGLAIFFGNSHCLSCSTPLGYDPMQARLLPLEPGPQAGTWVSTDVPDEVFRFCANRQSPAACNWLRPAAEEAEHLGLCRACRLNRTIPDLNDPQHPDNGALWNRVEQAKRRLVSALLVMGLPVASRVTEDPARGLMFDFLRSPDAGGHVLTGHQEGLITLNLAEADPARRESARLAMNEPYRTLVGHLRHEVGHYYWGRLVDNTGWMDGFRALFGNETQDYAASVAAYYQSGPRPDWNLHFVSAYASSHPWEDWAECWAHYMHMRDTVDTAMSYGLAIDSTQLEFTPFGADALYATGGSDAEDFLAFLNHWTQLTMLLNGMSRAMGQPDFYPFVLAHEVVAKLQFIHMVVVGVTQDEAA